MRTWIIVIVGIIVTAGVGYAAFVYTTLNGNPIKKASLQDSAQSYLNEKYDREMVVEEGTFNVNIGYGAEAHPQHNPNLTFQLYQTSEGNWTDQYPRTLWQKQIKEDVLPEIQEEYPNASHKIVGTFEEYNKGGQLPHYSEVDYSFNAVIRPPYEYQASNNETAELEKMLRLVDYYQNKNLQGGFKVSYPDKVFKFTTSEIKQIQNIEDLNEFSDRVG